MDETLIVYIIFFILGIIIYYGDKDLFINNKNGSKHSGIYIRTLKIIGIFLIIVSVFGSIGSFFFGG